jgi:maltose phosphorylase
MAGTWLAIVEGFGGMRILDGRVSLNPLIPLKWQSYSFHVRFRGVLFEVKVTMDYISVNNISDKELVIEISGKEYHLKGSEKIILSLKVDFFS